MASSPERPPLAERAKDPGFTPGIRELEGLLELVAGSDDELGKAAERAVLRIEARHRERVVRATVDRARAAVRPARGKLTRLAGRLAATAPDLAYDFLVSALEDADPKTRRNAARALGKLPPSPDLERVLVAAWDRAESDDDRRAIGEALGKVGGRDAAERVKRDATLGRAAVMLERAEARTAPADVDATRALERAARVRLHARAGLEAVVLEELDPGLRGRVAGAGIVEATLTGALERVTRARTALFVGFPLEPVPRTGSLAEDVVGALLSEPALAILRGFTRTRAGAPVRFRVAFAQGGHRRAVAWRIAELVRARSHELVNDPTASTWEVVVDEAEGRVALELRPRGLVDERFTYRVATVAASSHPTIAVAIARVAPRRADDVVWDPFVGAGAELVERARLGPYRALIGTDVDPKALAAAEENLARAGVAGATLERADACAYSPPGVTLIVTNPPMGRRVERGRHADLLERFVEHAARLLAPGGALVWTVPEPKRVRPRAERAGLVVERALTVDMGGFAADLSVYRKRRR